MVFSYLAACGGGQWDEVNSEFGEYARFIATDGRRGSYPADFVVFNLAETFGVDPRDVLEWPAAMFARARMWLSGRNQGERDRQANRNRDAGEGDDS